jgi:hypothetical protein
MLGILSLAKQLLASREWLYSRELVKLERIIIGIYDELERVKTDVVVAYFSLLQYLILINKITKNPGQNSQCWGRDSKQIRLK